MTAMASRDGAEPPLQVVVEGLAFGLPHGDGGAGRAVDDVAHGVRVEVHRVGLVPHDEVGLAASISR
jgi:hypothetical protein